MLVSKDQGIVFRDVLVDDFQWRGFEEICSCVEETILEDGVVSVKTEVLRIPLANELNQHFHEFSACKF